MLTDTGQTAAGQSAGLANDAFLRASVSVAPRRVGLTAQQKVEAKGKEKRVRTAQDHTVASLAVVSTTIALGVSDGSMHMLLAPQQSPIFCTCTVLKCFGTDLGGGR